MSRIRLFLLAAVPLTILAAGQLQAGRILSIGAAGARERLSARARDAAERFGEFARAAAEVARRARDSDPQRAGDVLPERWRSHLEGAGLIRNGTYASWSGRPAEAQLFPPGALAQSRIVERGMRRSLLVRTEASDAGIGVASFELELGDEGREREERSLTRSVGAAVSRWIWSPPPGGALAPVFDPGPPAVLLAPVTDATGRAIARVALEEPPAAARAAAAQARTRAWAALAATLLAAAALARRPAPVDLRRLAVVAGATVAARLALASGRTFEELLPRSVGTPSLYGHGASWGLLASPAALAATALAFYLVARAAASFAGTLGSARRVAATGALCAVAAGAVVAVAALSDSLPRDARLPVPRIDLTSWPALVVAAAIALAVAGAAELLAAAVLAAVHRGLPEPPGRRAVAVAVVPVAIVMLVATQRSADRVVEERLLQFAPLLTAESSQRRVALSAAVAEAASDPRAAAALSGGADTDATFTAFALWAEGDLFHQGFASSLDLYLPSGVTRSHFGFGLPRLVERETARAAPGVTPRAIDVEHTVVGSSIERVLHAEAPVLGAGGQILGWIVGHVLDEPDNLPFLPSSAPFLQALGWGADRTDASWSGNPEYVLFDEDGRVDLSTIHRPPAPSVELHAAAAAGRILTIEAGDQAYRVLGVSDGGRLHLLLLPAATILDILADGVRLLLLGLSVVAGIAVARRTVRSGRAGSLVDLIRASFYRKLLAAVLVASVVPLLGLALYLRAAIEQRAAESLAESASTVVGAAQRVVEDYQSPGAEDADAPPNRLTDETLSWLRRVVGQQIHLYEDGVIAATSQSEVFDSGLLGWRLPGEVDRALVREGRPYLVRAETWGSLALTVAYARVGVPGGPRNAVLAVPLVTEPRETGRAVDRLVQLLLIGTVSLVGLLALCAAWLARSVAEPVRRLAAASRSIAEGQYDTRLETEARDEMGSLVADFNRMGRALAGQRADLIRRRDYIEAVLRHATTGVVSTDAQGLVVTINPAAQGLLGGAAGAPARGDQLLAVLDRSAATRPLAEGLAGPSGVSGEPFEVDLGAVDRPVRLRVVRVPLPDPAGGETGTLVLLDDVTGLMRSNQLAAWAEMARAIAHEIKNPLTPIQLSTEHMRRVLADRGALPSAEIESCLDTIVRQVRELRDISSAFSTYARLPDLAQARVDPAALLREVVAPYRVAPPDGVTIEERHDRAPEILGDARALARAIVNLIENALQAMPRGGRLSVGSRGDASGRAVLTVSDTGPGLSPEARARLFTPYFSTKTSGTGLGLAITRRVVEAHGGTISVEDAAGGGTRFSIVIPPAR